MKYFSGQNKVEISLKPLMQTPLGEKTLVRKMSTPHYFIKMKYEITKRNTK